MDRKTMIVGDERFSTDINYAKLIDDIKLKKPELKSNAKVIEFSLQRLYDDVLHDYVRVPKEQYDLLLKLQKESLEAYYEYKQKNK